VSDMMLYASLENYWIYDKKKDPMCFIIQVRVWNSTYCY